ncbi:MAG: cytochrome c peroxidase, partial [Arenibacterium sp.]
MSKVFSAPDSSITTRSGRFSFAWTVGLAVAVLVAVGAGAYLGKPPATTPIRDFQAPFVFGRFAIPPDNPLTEEAFELGRHLFYDPLLSGDNSMSCASCHEQARAFTDGQTLGIGHGGQTLEFQSISLAKLLLGPPHFLWVCRSATLVEQVV